MKKKMKSWIRSWTVCSSSSKDTLSRKYINLQELVKFTQISDIFGQDIEQMWDSKESDELRFEVFSSKGCILQSFVICIKNVVLRNVKSLVWVKEIWVENIWKHVIPKERRQYISKYFQWDLDRKWQQRTKVSPTGS